MKQKIIIEDIKGLDFGKDKVYIIQVDKRKVSEGMIYQLSMRLDRFHIRHIIAPFEVKFAEKVKTYKR